MKKRYIISLLSIGLIPNLVSCGCNGKPTTATYKVSFIGHNCAVKDIVEAGYIAGENVTFKVNPATDYVLPNNIDDSKIIVNGIKKADIIYTLTSNIASFTFLIAR